jgi:hypothetical protein
MNATRAESSNAELILVARKNNATWGKQYIVRGLY